MLIFLFFWISFFFSLGPHASHTLFFPYLLQMLWYKNSATLFPYWFHCSLGHFFFHQLVLKIDYLHHVVKVYISICGWDAHKTSILLDSMEWVVLGKRTWHHEKFLFCIIEWWTNFQQKNELNTRIALPPRDMYYVFARQLWTTWTTQQHEMNGCVRMCSSTIRHVACTIFSYQLQLVRYSITYNNVSASSV